MTKKDNYKSLKFKKLKAGKTLSKKLTIKNVKNDPLGALIDNNKYAIDFSLGSFGNINFVFEELYSDKKLCKAIRSKNDEEWLYIDIINDKLIDFNKPFI